MWGEAVWGVSVTADVCYNNYTNKCDCVIFATIILLYSYTAEIQ